MAIRFYNWESVPAVIIEHERGERGYTYYDGEWHNGERSVDIIVKATRLTEEEFVDLFGDIGVPEDEHSTKE